MSKFPETRNLTSHADNGKEEPPNGLSSVLQKPVFAPLEIPQIGVNKHSNDNENSSRSSSELTSETLYRDEYRKASRSATTTNDGETDMEPAEQTAEVPFIYVSQPLKRAAQDLWTDANEAVRKPNGKADPFEAVGWIMTRKSRESAPWTELEEGNRAIEEMRKETFDMDRMRRLEEEAEEEKMAEERRLENKRRYRPRRKPAAKKAKE